jgi:oligosaccharyltransferase complex subunit beta
LQDEGYHTTIVSNPTTNLISSQLITGTDRSSLGPVLFRGVALTSNEKNALRLEVLTADTTAYSFNPTATVVNEYPAAVGKSTLLVGAMQARNNARVVLCGSLETFGNAFLRAEVNRNGRWGEF